MRGKANRGQDSAPGPPLTPPGLPASDYPFQVPLSQISLLPALYASRPSVSLKGRLPGFTVSRRRPSVATSGPRLLLAHLPALATKTLFGSLRETLSLPFVLKDSLAKIQWLFVAILFLKQVDTRPQEAVEESNRGTVSTVQHKVSATRRSQTASRSTLGPRALHLRD